METAIQLGWRSSPLVKSRVIDSTDFGARTLVTIDFALVRPHAVFLAMVESGKVNDSLKQSVVDISLTAKNNLVA